MRAQAWDVWHVRLERVDSKKLAGGVRAGVSVIDTKSRCPHERGQQFVWLAILLSLDPWAVACKATWFSRRFIRESSSSCIPLYCRVMSAAMSKISCFSFSKSL
eukprot:6172581-Pleurochrysis_carterae.AAC.4